MDKKRLIFATIFLVVVIIIGYVLYWVFFKKEPTTITTIPTTQIPGTGEFPTAGSGVPTIPTTTGADKLPTAGTISTTVKPETIKPSLAFNKAVDTPILGANPDKNNQAKFYNKTDGKFYRLGADGQVTALSDEVFYNVQKVTWSPVKNESIIEYPDGSNIYYNFDTKKQASLPKHWEEFSFSNLGDKVAAKSIGFSPENRWLITADPEGKNIKLIEPMGENADKVIVDWSPNNQIVAMSQTGETLGSDRQELLFVGLNGENFQSTIVEGRGLQTTWSPEGKKLLYSVYNARNDFKPELWEVNAEGDNIGSDRRLLGVNTWATKCSFDDPRFVYCGVPTKLDSGAGFAPDLAQYTPDAIVKIDLETGLKTEIPSDKTHVVDTIFTSEDGKTLYFTDKNQIGLFSLPVQ